MLTRKQLLPILSCLMFMLTACGGSASSSSSSPNPTSSDTVLSWMVKFLASFTADQAALLISILAILASVRANSIAQQARKFSENVHRQAERVRVFEKRTEILSEIDTQNTRFGTLLAIIAEKMLFIQKSPELLQSHSIEHERLSQNLIAIKKLHSRYEEQRGLTEQVGEGADLAQQEEVLAEIRRMTIHLNETIKQEESQLEELKRLSKEAAQTL